jgi:hypothetical protein
VFLSGRNALLGLSPPGVLDGRFYLPQQGFLALMTILCCKVIRMQLSKISLRLSRTYRSTYGRDAHFVFGLGAGVTFVSSFGVGSGTATTAGTLWSTTIRLRTAGS